MNKIVSLISGKNRRKKYDYFIDRFAPGNKTTILDVGASNEEYSATDNFLEKKYPFPENITALSINKNDKLKKRYPKVKCILYDGVKFPFKDNAFDICWSNAVIEHVGGDEKQIIFIKEIRRVAKRVFITTPNRNFPIEIHTRIPLLHFLPKKMFDKCLCFIGKRWATGSYMYLLGLNDIMKLLKKCNITKYEIIKNKILCFAIDFGIIF